MDLPYQQVYFSKTWWCTGFMAFSGFRLSSSRSCFFSFFLYSFSFKENKSFYVSLFHFLFHFAIVRLQNALKTTVNKIESLCKENNETNWSEIRRRIRWRWTKKNEIILRWIKRTPMKMVKMCYFLLLLSILLYSFLFFYSVSSRFWESFHRKWIFIWCSQMYFNMPLMCVLNIFLYVRVRVGLLQSHIYSVYVLRVAAGVDRHIYLSRVRRMVVIFHS